MFKIYPQLINSFRDLVHQRKNKSEKENGIKYTINC